MYLLDTDHLSLLERGGEGTQPLLSRLAAIEPDKAGVTIISYEEQTRDWFSFMAKARTIEAQIKAYRQLQQHLQIFCAVPIVALDERAAGTFQSLQRQGLRIGTMDLKIAAIALARDATLLTRNLSDFNLIAGLRAEDWSS